MLQYTCKMESLNTAFIIKWKRSLKKGIYIAEVPILTFSPLSQPLHASFPGQFRKERFHDRVEEWKIGRHSEMMDYMLHQSLLMKQKIEAIIACVIPLCTFRFLFSIIFLLTEELLKFLVAHTSTSVEFFQLLCT